MAPSLLFPGGPASPLPPVLTFAQAGFEWDLHGAAATAAAAKTSRSQDPSSSKCSFCVNLRGEASMSPTNLHLNSDIKRFACHTPVGSQMSSRSQSDGQQAAVLPAQHRPRAGLTLKGQSPSPPAPQPPTQHTHRAQSLPACPIVKLQAADRKWQAEAPINHVQHLPTFAFCLLQH